MNEKKRALITGLFLCLKSSTHFRAYFTPVARSIITADGPGGSSGIITTFKPTHMRMPVYPFNPDATYPYPS